jgi:hypothetical protein
MMTTWVIDPREATPEGGIGRQCRPRGDGNVPSGSPGLAP